MRRGAANAGLWSEVKGLACIYMMYARIDIGKEEKDNQLIDME